MDEEKLIHDWLVRKLKERLSRDYNEIQDNIEGQRHEFDDCYPDIILGNHGMVLAVLEVETEHSINSGKAAEWKRIAESGTKLILMVPKKSVKYVTSLLWEQGIMDKASIGTYDVVIAMP
ncbi:hypothetical protein BMS3Bbin06_00651 [bacterium BMS3Bbin06]|nr:hypothetical protein BMS3Abin08_02347 [bacterium BMS3Abin08]GBE34132.1 hypothetical protein BMS3Bbin06_00651 [bacterium BMS3Bbin06]HDH00281.1 hypothetical protein [Nitrospirota bacterium]HDY71778.1 hypothetical protein [Nitrospirota bacterium]